MNIKRSVACTVNPSQIKALFRDIRRNLNFSSSERDLEGIIETSSGLLSEDPRWLPEFLCRAELHFNGTAIELVLEARAGNDCVKAIKLADQLAYKMSEMFSNQVKSFRSHVFGIGFPKTGSTSLTAAMRMLGLFSWHFSPWILNLTSVHEEIPSSEPDFSCIADYTFLSDLPINKLYRDLDKAFPGSLFILTIRPIEAWLASALAEAERNALTRGMMIYIDRWLYDSQTIDKEVFRSRYLQHEIDVREYFSDRSDLLIIDVTQGGQWEKLCGFLGLPVPDLPFPHLNQRLKQ